LFGIARRRSAAFLLLEAWQTNIWRETMKKNLAIGPLLLMVSAVTIFGQNVVSSSRLKAEEAIRSAIYETTFAALTADMKSYKEHAARHMLNLYKLMYEELIKDTEMVKTFQQNGIKGWEDFMASRVRQSSRRFASLSRTDCGVGPP